MIWALAVVSVLTLMIFICQMMSSNLAKSPSAKASKNWNYSDMKILVQSQNIRLPAMFVDMDIFDRNAKKLINIVRSSGKTMRVATKSIRSVDLLQRLQNLGQGVLVSYMTYSVEEAQLLSQHGFDDFYIPYPLMQQPDIDLALDLTSKGKAICLTVDSVPHIQRLDRLCEEYFKARNIPEAHKVKLRVAADLDVSLKIFRGLVSFGPHRSELDSVEKFCHVLNAAVESKNIKLVGVMGYEAHVAGLPDDSPYSPLPNSLIRTLKKFFMRFTVDFREEISSYCKDNSIEMEFFNVGGSGNIQEACKDPTLTEVTVGSAFLQSQIFDYYTKNKCEGAFCFALQATRVNKKYICCQSGGFVASGSCSEDKFPKPFSNPVKLQHYKTEGYGEVQTPLRIMSTLAEPTKIEIGDPVFFRPAKAGEIGEHFKKYYTKREYSITGEVKTYRGLGHVFY